MSQVIQKSALGYIRISDKKQIEGESPETQRRKIQEYANSNNIKILEWFYDEAKSGKNTDREELQNMLKMAKKRKGKINHIIVYKMSRASRNIETYVMDIVSVLAPLKINIVSATEHFDNTTPMGRFMQYLQVLIDQLDNENKQEVVTDNMSSLALQGYWLHHPPRGYDRLVIKDSEGKPRTSITPNNEAAQVKDVLMRWNRGDMTEAKLVRYATSIGLIGSRTGRPLNQDVLHKMITNPVYAGYVCGSLTDYQRVEGKHQGLITPEVFEQNQLIYKMKNKDYLLGLKHQKTNELYPLRRFVRCVHCSKHMTACQPKNSPRYFCHRCAKSGSVMTKILHDQFEELLRIITPLPGTTRLAKEVLKRQVNKELGGINKDIKRVLNSLDANNAYREKILNKFINDKITEADRVLAIRGADEEKLSLQTELANLEQRQTISEDHIEYALNFMADISTRWHNAPLELKQTYQKLVFPEGFVYDIKNQKIITPNISPLYRVIQTDMRAIDTKNFAMVTPRGIEPLLPG